MRDTKIKKVRRSSVIRETLYTSIGAAALAVDFVTSPQKQQNWLKKAERRGSKLATTSQRQIRPVTKQVESAIEELRVNSLSALGLAERRTHFFCSHSLYSWCLCCSDSRLSAVRAYA